MTLSAVCGSTTSRRHGWGENRTTEFAEQMSQPQSDVASKVPHLDMRPVFNMHGALHLRPNYRLQFAINYIIAYSVEISNRASTPNRMMLEECLQGSTARTAPLRAQSERVNQATLNSAKTRHPSYARSSVAFGTGSATSDCHALLLPSP